MDAALQKSIIVVTYIYIGHLWSWQSETGIYTGIHRYVQVIYRYIKVCTGNIQVYKGIYRCYTGNIQVCTGVHVSGNYLGHLWPYLRGHYGYRQVGNTTCQI